MTPDQRLTATLDKLTSIDTTLKAMLLVLSQGRAEAAPTVPDRVLDGPHGDPDVRQKDPRDWAGDSMKGKRFSECPADYLDLLAERYDYFAGRETDEKKAGYNRLDAQRARGWAARLRGGWVAPTTGRVNEAESEPRW